MRYFFILIISCLTQVLTGQGFRVRHYTPGSTTNLTKAIFEVSPGNYITGGIIVETINNVPTNRLCIMGLDAQGQIQWTKKYGNSKFEYLNNGLVSRTYYKQGNFIYYAGCARDSNNNQQGVLIKFDMNGDTLWRKIYRDPDPQEDVIPQKVTGSVDGGFLITGFFQNNSNTPYSKCMLIKTDVNGNELWRRKIAKVTPDTQDGQAIVQDPVSKKIVMVGYQYIGNSNSWTIHDNVVITDSLGNLPARYNYCGFSGILKDVILTSDQKVIAVGFKYFPQTLGGYNLMKSFAVKFDLNTPSSPIWTKEIDKLSLNNGFSCLTESADGNFIIGGFYDTLQINNIFPNYLVRITKISPDGTVISNRNYDYKINAPTSDNNIGMRSIENASDGSLIAAIECFNFPGPNPFFFVKFDSTGCDSTVAYCQSILSTGIYKNKLKELEVELFPNPVSDYLTVNINTESSKEKPQLNITDIAGREVKQIELEDVNKIDLRGLANGVYLLNITNGRELLYSSKVVKKE